VTDGSPLEDLDYAYLTTTGRRSGRPHRIEIWFALVDGVVFFLSGGGDRSDWVRNLVSPEVVVELGNERRTRPARVVTDGNEDRLARAALVSKYTPRYRGDLEEWGRTSLPIAVDWTERTDATAEERTRGP
jgi:deazaflavin-dependent oxidoreductase (nitroreductase family)